MGKSSPELVREIPAASSQLATQLNVSTGLPPGPDPQTTTPEEMFGPWFSKDPALQCLGVGAEPLSYKGQEGGRWQLCLGRFHFLVVFWVLKRPANIIPPKP